MKGIFNLGNFLSFVCVTSDKLNSFNTKFLENMKHSEVKVDALAMADFLHVSLSKTFNLMKSQIKEVLQVLNSNTYSFGVTYWAILKI